VCPFFQTCSYQVQKADPPQVWIIAHTLLFQAQAAIGKPGMVVIDEGFWGDGLWAARRGITLDEIETVRDAPGSSRFAAAYLRPHRIKLAAALRRQTEQGGLLRRHLIDEGLTAEICGEAIALEWRLKTSAAIWPAMPADARRRAAEAMRGAKHVRAIVNVWDAVRGLLDHDDPQAVSGRLWFKDQETEHGIVRTVMTRGVKGIARQWSAPTILLDATLPGQAILERYYPNVEIVADLEAAAPHQSVRQVIRAPVARRKLFNSGDAQRNLKALRHYILGRWLQFGRQPTLVICQGRKRGAGDVEADDTEQWLRASALPKNIKLAHFKAIAGLDAHKHVRLLITVGRTQPSPDELEQHAAAMTGLEPAKAGTKPNGSRWFDKVARGIRMRDGTGRAVLCDKHPDQTVEAIRQQVCEAEIVQAVGRARGVNRTAVAPVQIDILGDVVLPVTVDEAPVWDEAAFGDKVEMLAEGAVIESPTDMARVWPAVWATAEAARAWLARRFPGQNPCKDKQTIIVQHVQVNEGGQAVVAGRVKPVAKRGGRGVAASRSRPTGRKNSGRGGKGQK
jgi:putative DNA primase/helicase